jgi:hypothetical protein
MIAISDSYQDSSELDAESFKPQRGAGSSMAQLPQERNSE